MKWIRRLLFLALIIIVGFVSVVLFMLYRETHPPVYAFPVQQTGILAEPEAIDITRQAVSRSGRNPEEYTPVSWGNREFEGQPELVFARNTINPNAGYVLWAHESGEPARRLRVGVKKLSSVYECQIWNAK